MTGSGKVIPGGGNRLSKGSGARLSLVCTRNLEKTGVARRWWARKKQRLRRGQRVIVWVPLPVMGSSGFKFDKKQLKHFTKEGDIWRSFGW